MTLRASVGVLVFGLAVPWASAQVPAGGEFQVNSYTTGVQYGPAVASDAAGDFVVVWTSWGQDGSYSGVIGQRYDSSGARRGLELQINSAFTSNQARPSVASDAAGDFVVAWQSWGQDASTGDGVFAQRYDASGVPRGSEFQVNTYTSADQRYPTVASDASGNFIVAWASGWQDGYAWGIFAQRYDGSGTPLGSEFRVNGFTTGEQRAPRAAGDAAGDFVVVWQSAGQDGSGWGIFGRRYDASGTPLGAEFLVNTHTGGDQMGPVVASSPAGSFVVAWTGNGQDGSATGIFAQRYDVSGVSRGLEFQVNTYTTGEQIMPSVAVDAAGDFVVAWYQAGASGHAGVFGQRYNSSGMPRGGEFRVNTHTTGGQSLPSVASDATGNFVVAWEGTGLGDNQGVFAQRFGGLQPVGLAVDASSSSGSDGDGVLEPGETGVAAAPLWKNLNGETQTFDGNALGFTGPLASGASYVLTASSATYGTVASGATAPCDTCYEVGVGFSGMRPATH